MPNKQIKFARKKHGLGLSLRPLIKAFARIRVRTQFPLKKISESGLTFDIASPTSLLIVNLLLGFVALSANLQNDFLDQAMQIFDNRATFVVDY